MNNVQESAAPQGPPPRKQVTIYVNTRPHIVTKEKISFSEVVALSGLPGGENITFSVSYRRGGGHSAEGSLVEGQSVQVQDGMIFNVTRTDKS
jgi:hypothetical protein